MQSIQVEFKNKKVENMIDCHFRIDCEKKTDYSNQIKWKFLVQQNEIYEIMNIECITIFHFQLV